MLSVPYVESSSTEMHSDMPESTPSPTPEAVRETLSPGSYYSLTEELPVYAQAHTASEIIDTLLPGAIA